MLATIRRALPGPASILAALLLGAALGLPAPAAAQWTFTEDFTTTTFKDDVATSADWNTDAGQLGLYGYDFSIAGNLALPGLAYAVEVHGNRAYVVDGYGLRIVDITDPTSPVLLGSYIAPNAAVDVTVHGKFAILALTTSGIEIVDISDPAAPSLVGSAVTVGYAKAVGVTGNTVCVASDYDGLELFDITNPWNPVALGTFDTPYRAEGITVRDNLAFVGDGTTGLMIFDVGDPAAPALVGSYNTPNYAYMAALSGDHAYIPDNNTGLVVLDISNPAAPTHVATLGGFRAVWAEVVGNRAYVLDGNWNLQIVDITNPSAPAVVGSIGMPAFSYQVDVSGRYAYVAASSGDLQVVEIGAWMDAAPVGSVEGTDFLYDVVIDGNIAVLVDGNNGLRLVDVTDPADPVVLGSVGVPGTAARVAVVGDLAYVAVRFAGLQIVDISDPTAPTLLGSVFGLSAASALDVVGDTVFVADDFTGLRAIDVSDPMAPFEITSIWIGGGAFDVDIVGHLAYVSASNRLDIVDISDPLNTVAVGNVLLPSSGRAEVDGDLIYATSGTPDVHVVDVSDPGNPVHVSSFTAPNYVNDLAVSGDRLFVAASYSGVQVMDMSAPSAPVAVDIINLPGQARALTVDGDVLYATDYHNQLAGRMHSFLIATDQFDPTRNTGRSTIIDDDTADILGARLTATQAPGVTWELSADGGWNWTPWEADGVFRPFPSVGSNLLWRSTHAFTGVNPTVSDLTIDWLVNHASITSVSDVPGDQGGQVRLSFNPSGYDFASEAAYPITGYQVYRRIDDPALLARIADEGAEVGAELASTLPASFAGGPVRAIGDRAFLVGGDKAQGSFPAGTWEFVSWVAATQSGGYVGTVPTLADSSAAGGIAWSVFTVTAHTTSPSVWFSCPPDSGYSVDNIAPAAPQGLVAGGGVLSWDPATERDFAHFTVYGSDAADPGTATVVGHSVSPSFDVSGASWTFYFVTTTDAAGNESPATQLSATSGVGDTPQPRALAVGCHPNPFNPATVINFAVPRSGRVSVGVYDVSGRLVRRLVDAEPREAGTHSVAWDGRSDAGRAAASGLYLVRIVSGGEAAAVKVTLSK